MFSTFKLAIVGGIIFTIVGAFWYVSGLQSDLAKSQQNVSTLESSVEQQVQVIDQMQRDQEKIFDARDDMRDLVQSQKKEIDSLRSRFNESSNGSKRDIGELAVQKPTLIKNIINKASSKAVRCIEIASGAKLTKEEINANSNSECNFDNSSS